MDNKIEHIIRNYQYFELDEAQKQLIVDWAENSDEFEALQNTLLATDQFVQSQKEELNPVIKQRLDVRFAEKYDQTRLVWYNKLLLFLWPNESPFYKRPLIQFAAICLIVAISIPFFPDVSKQQLAMNEVEKIDKDRNVEREVITHEEELIEEVDKRSIAEEKEVSEDESNLKDNVITKTTDESTRTANQEGWILNDEKTVTGVERSEAKGEAAMVDVPMETEDREDADYFYDKTDMDAPALKQLSMNRRAKDAEVPKKVETKETLDLLTALY